MAASLAKEALLRVERLADAPIRGPEGKSPKAMPVEGPVSRRKEVEEPSRLPDIAPVTKTPIETVPVETPQQKISVAAAPVPPVASQIATRPPTLPARAARTPKDGMPPVPKESPVEAGDAPPIENAVLAASDTKVRAVAAASPDRGEIAFAVQVRPAAFHDEAPTSTAEPVMDETPAQAPAPKDQPLTKSTMVMPATEPARAPLAEQERKPAEVDRTAPSRPVPSTHVIGTENIPVARAVERGTQTGIAEQEARPEQTPVPEAVQPDVKPASPGAPPRGIKLEVAGGERRVEVRLSERAGELRVAVRTPDSHLAGTLRENLPELATRFTQSGIRSEIWRPASTQAGEWRHTTVPLSRALGQDGDSRSGQQGGGSQEDARQRQARDAQSPKSNKEKGKDFAWLMSSLR
jgi:hypothetical protein